MNTDVVSGAAKLAGTLTGQLANALLSIPSVIGKVITSLLKLTTVIGVTLVGAATAAGAALLYLTKQSFQSIDALRVISVKLGISTEALSTFSLAAEESGTSLDTVAGSIVKLQKAIGEAVLKTGAQRDALNQLGLSAAKLIGLKPEQQFLQVAAALAKVTSQTDKVRIALALFGKGGADIIPFLAEDLNDAARAAKTLNLVISDFDAAQIDAAGDSVGRLKAAFTGVGNYLAAQLAPIITGITQKAIGLIAANGGIAAIMERTIAAVTARSVALINGIGAAMEQVRDFIGDIGISPQTIGGSTSQIFEFIADMVRKSSIASNAIYGIFESLKTGVLSLLRAVATPVDLFFAALQKMDALLGHKNSGAFVEGFRGAIQDIDKQIEESAARAAGYFSDAFSGVSPQIENVAQKIESLGTVTGNAVTFGAKKFKQFFIDTESGFQNLSTGSINDFIEKLSMTVPGNIPGTTGRDAGAAANYFETAFGGIFSRGSGPSKAIDDFLKHNKTVTDEMQRIWTRTADSISDSLAHSLLSGENAFKSLRDVALQVAEQILSAYLNKAIISPIINALTGGFGGGFSAAGAGISPSSGASLATASANAAPPPIAFNFYGPVSSEAYFKQQAIEALKDPRAKAIIEGTSYNNTASQLRRRVSPLGGR